jgi:hypothetical protein
VPQLHRIGQASMSEVLPLVVIGLCLICAGALLVFAGREP